MKTVSFSFCDFLCHRVRYTALLLRRSLRWPRYLYGHNEKKTTSGDAAKRYSSMNTKLLCITEDLSLEYTVIIKIILRK